MFNSLFVKIRNFHTSLRLTILSTFILIFILMTASITLIRGIAFRDELLYTSNELMKQTSHLVLKQITSSINPIEVGAIFSTNLFKSGLIENDPFKIMTYTYYMVDSIPLLQGAYWGDEQGNFMSTRQENDGTITNEIILHDKTQHSHTVIHHDLNGKAPKEIKLNTTNYDPRTRTWYLAAKKAQTFTWTDVYQIYPDYYQGVSASSPVYDKQHKLIGVLGLVLRLDFLSQFMTQLNVSKNGYAFIITDKEDLVAYPNRKPFPDAGLAHHRILNVHQSAQLRLIDESIDHYKKTGEKEFALTYEGERFLINYQAIPDFAAHGWLVGVIAPENDFLSYLNKINLITLALSLFTLILGSLAVSSFATRVAKPIKMLVKETKKIKRFELEGKIHLKSRITEVMDLKNAIVSMKNGLREFQRYVPKVLVQQLIESGQNARIGGERIPLVVFFSDIENFTSIAEVMEPNDLMLQICEYFEALTQVIISQKGTVDKYIGDSIMAFWGAPLPEVEANDLAVRAAWLCQVKVDELNAKWAKEGKPPFYTRFGIHAGDAIVGNLGSSERLNYTALGDTVNIASRLEAINKIYKTHIIVSETVYNKLKYSFFFRLLDNVKIKGRSHSIVIYELLGDDIGQVPYDLEAYNAEFEKGFVAYEEKKWREAIAYFQHCLAIYPEDAVARIFIARCQKEKGQISI
ncbi:MAG: adenylate/guanylate cyclase domain-containing protein [Gammaproteobacteria bacterium]|nr:adenylate/guanylate cyclase domain-containing protein [Gammaproteobacteria bacterium]